MIAVITCDRPTGVSYLRDTLDSIDSSARDKNRIVFIDGAIQLPDLPAGWEQRLAPHPVTATPAENKWTAWAAIRMAAAYGEDLLLCEDDIQFCRNGVARTETVKVPDDVAFLSYFAPYGDLTMVEGIWRTAMPNFGYAQCLKIPLRTCQVLTDAWPEMRDARCGGTDVVIRYIGTKRRWLYGVHYPGVVQHVGAVSIFGTGKLAGCRVSRAYPGDDYDAHSLWIQHYT